VYEIAKSKQSFDPVLQEIPLQSLAKTIVASAKSMGIQIIGGKTVKNVSLREGKVTT
jgi:ribosomal protein L11